MATKLRFRLKLHNNVDIEVKSDDLLTITTDCNCEADVLLDCRTVKQIKRLTAVIVKDISFAAIGQPLVRVFYGHELYWIKPCNLTIPSLLKNIGQ